MKIMKCAKLGWTERQHIAALITAQIISLHKQYTDYRTRSQIVRSFIGSNNLRDNMLAGNTNISAVADQRGRTMFRVIEYFAVTMGHSRSFEVTPIERARLSPF